MMTLLLDAPSLTELVQRVGLQTLMRDLITRMNRSLRSMDSGSFDIPVRDGFDYQLPRTGLVEWMPLHELGKTVTIKIVSYHPANPATTGLPTILSNVSCYDVASGHLMALMDGSFLTALRTGAASAVASQVLARPDSSTLGIVGCGAQAVTQLHALSSVFPIERVVIFDVERAAMQSFADRCQSFLDATCEIQHANAPEIVVLHADILCTCTSVDAHGGPVFSERATTQQHLHINAVGSDFPGKTELPRRLLEQSLVCPDFKSQALREGECQQLEVAEIGPELRELVRDAAAHKSHRERLTVFDSTGWALEDHIAASMLIEHAQAMNLGRFVQIESTSQDPRDPYAFIGSLETSQIH